MSGCRLEARGISKAFGGVTAVDDVSLVAEAGSITGIVGPNGAGKTTLFNLLTGIYVADSGQLLVGGTVVPRSGWQPHKIARLGVARTFQSARVFPNLNVLDNVLIGAENAVVSRGDDPPYPPGRARWLRHGTGRAGGSRGVEQAGLGYGAGRAGGGRGDGEAGLGYGAGRAGGGRGDGEAGLGYGAGQGQGRKSSARLAAEASALLAALGLAERSRDPASTLPAGSQKVVELARVLLARPKALLLDEPASGLSETETARLADTLVAVRSLGITVVIVDHNLRLVMGICDQVVVMDAGRVIAAGDPAAVQADSAVRAAYLGAAQ